MNLLWNKNSLHQVGYYWDKYTEMHGQQNVKEISLNLCTGRPPIGVMIPEAV